MKIRIMEIGDCATVTDMMRGFYASDAVLTNGSDEIFSADASECVSDSPYLEGYVFENDGGIQGYAMCAKSFSTEFGKRCIWVEDLFVKEEYRGKGVGSQFLSFISDKYSDCVIRLEAEAENERAIHVYKKAGFEVLPYTELIKLR